MGAGEASRPGPLSHRHRALPAGTKPPSLPRHGRVCGPCWPLFSGYAFPAAHPLYNLQLSCSSAPLPLLTNTSSFPSPVLENVRAYRKLKQATATSPLGRGSPVLAERPHLPPLLPPLQPRALRVAEASGSPGGRRGAPPVVHARGRADLAQRTPPVRAGSAQCRPPTPRPKYLGRPSPLGPPAVSHPASRLSHAPGGRVVALPLPAGRLPVEPGRSPPSSSRVFLVAGSPCPAAAAVLEGSPLGAHPGRGSQTPGARDAGLLFSVTSQSA